MAEEHKTPTRDRVVEDLTAAERYRGVQEFPKMLYRTSGDQLIVHNKTEEETALAAGDVHPNPEAALKEKAKRDAAEAKRLAERAGGEAKASGKPPQH